MNRTYTVKTDRALVYVTDAFISRFGSESLCVIPAELTAPEHGMMAVSKDHGKTIAWFDEKGTEQIVLKRNIENIKPISVLRKISLTEENLTPLHTSFEVIEPGVVKAVKTEKILEDDTNSLVKVNGLKFRNAVIEFDCKAEFSVDAPDYARGFIGVGFRISEDDSRFEGFYIRPTNGIGCVDPYRKAHGCQYFAYPGYIWSYLREFHYEGYEAPVPTIELGRWAHIRIELIEDTARYYVNHECVMEMNGNFFHIPEEGGFGFNCHIGTDSYFRNLYIEILD